MVDLRDSQGRRWQIAIGSEQAVCDEKEVENPHAFEIDARPNRIWVDNELAHVVKVGDDWWIHLDGAIHIVSIDEQGAGSGGDSDGMVAPMPGKVLEILCAEGDLVEEGQTLIVDASESFNPKTGNDEDLSYQWSFDNDPQSSLKNAIMDIIKDF